MFFSHTVVVALSSYQGIQMIISKVLNAYTKGNKNTKLFSKSLVEDPQYTYENSHKSRTKESSSKTSHKCTMFRFQKTCHT